MRLIIDIGHPGHVHLFRPFAVKMAKEGHNVLFTCRQKEFVTELLTFYGFQFINLGKHRKNKLNKILGLFIFEIRLLAISLKFKPDIFLSHGSFYAAHIAWLIRKPHISFEDTFNFEQIKLYKPFTKIILSSDYQQPDLGKNNIRYKGYHELAYLHPNQFKPDIRVLNELGIDKDERYVIIRFVSWNATHDSGHKGMSLENKIKTVKEFIKICKVFISSEKDLPEELKKYKFPLAPEKMHDVLAFASLVFGESATMVSEGVVLGTPGIYLDNTGRLYTKEQQEKYDLVYNFSESEIDQEKAIEKGIELLLNKSLKKDWEFKKNKMLSEKIDVTAFLIWFVENYPKSVKIMKENPDYQLRFK